TASQFDQIAIQPPRNASYHVGDSLLIARIDRDIAGWGGVEVPVGVARVTELQRRQVLADVVMQFGRIHDGHLAMPLEPFKDPGLTRPTPVEQGLEVTSWPPVTCTTWPTSSRSSSSIAVVPKGSRRAMCSRSSGRPRVFQARRPKRCVWCSRSCTPGSIRPPDWCSRSTIPTSAPECRSVSSGRCLPDLRPAPFGTGVSRPVVLVSHLLALGLY